MSMPDGLVRRFAFCFARASKFNLETEEYVDFFVHRRLAAVIVACMGALDMPWLFTPNRITFCSLAAGVASAYCVMQAGYATSDPDPRVISDWLLRAAALELLSITLDCCDGQLARMYGSGSLVGRVLDGICDMLVALSHGFAWTYVLVYRFNMLPVFGGWALLILSCVTFQQQAMMFDRIKNLYCLKTTTPPEDRKSPQVVGLEESQLVEKEIERARSTSSWGSYALLVWYRSQYLAVQNKVAKKTVERTLSEAAQLEPEAYRARWRSTMRLVSWCGTGTHALLFYGLLAAAALLQDVRVMAIWYPVNNLVLTGCWLVCLDRVKSM